VYQVGKMKMVKWWRKIREGIGGDLGMNGWGVCAGRAGSLGRFVRVALESEGEGGGNFRGGIYRNRASMDAHDLAGKA
jgi:hypothetical protein